MMNIGGGSGGGGGHGGHGPLMKRGEDRHNSSSPDSSSSPVELYHSVQQPIASLRTRGRRERGRGEGGREEGRREKGVR